MSNLLNQKLLTGPVFGSRANSAPITYTANGKQYVAVVVGYGGAQAASFPQLTPEIPVPVVRSSAIAEPLALIFG